MIEEPRTLTKTELRAFNDQTTGNRTGSHLQSQLELGGVPQDFTTVVMTLATNLVEPVTVIDIRPIKECAEPFNGTYFQVYRQGSGANPNVKLGVDLDNPDPHAQQLDDQGLLTDSVYFADNNVVLKPREPITFSVAALTRRYGCSFKFEVLVATPAGTVTQVVDNSGEPFRVTAKAPPKDPLFPLSGYSVAYVQGAGNVWRAVDPGTYRGSR
ncbi:hypothetical protein ACLTEW_24265 [Gordonia lacunae]|uniref:hypothetical protein n=1 Tax=Gordonia TaxID=2053 RepID=UPI00200ACDC7|nr:hypothetical protein [Gordonia terrae]UPW11978.1 hypothetical protein M1C59_25825 [Gordonia terrae]